MALTPPNAPGPRKITKPGNITIPSNQLLNVLSKASVSERASLASSQAGQRLLAVLTPTELASIFPDYYKRSDPDVSGFIKATSRRYAGIPAGQEYSVTAKAYEGSSIKGVWDPGLTRQKKQQYEKSLENSAVDKIQRELGLKIDPSAKAKLSAQQEALLEELKKRNIKADDPNAAWLKKIDAQTLKKAGIEIVGEGDKAEYKYVPIATPTKADIEPSDYAKKYSRTQDALGISGAEYDAYRKSVGAIESGNNPNMGAGGANAHYWGKYQFGSGATTDTNKLLGENIDKTQFKGNEDLAEKYFDAYSFLNHRTLMNTSREYRDLSPQQKLAVLGYAHNQGAGGAKKWLESGVAGKDAFGTSGTKYSDSISKSLQNVTPTVEDIQKQRENALISGIYATAPDYASEIIKKEWHNLPVNVRAELSNMPPDKLKGGKGTETLSTITGYEGKVGQGLGAPRPHGAHQGVDIMMPHGSPIRARGDGVVIKSEIQGGQLNTQYGGTSGGIVTVRYADGHIEKYMHTSDQYEKTGPLMKPGQVVKAGDIIAKSGTAAGTPHLHHEMYKTSTMSIEDMQKEIKDKGIDSIGGTHLTNTRNRIDPMEHYGYKQGDIIKSDYWAKSPNSPFKTAESIQSQNKPQEQTVTEKPPEPVQSTTPAEPVSAPPSQTTAPEKPAPVEAYGGSIPGSQHTENIKAFPIKTDLKAGKENIALVDMSKDKAKMLAAVNSDEKLTYQDDKIHVKSKVNPQELEPQKKDYQSTQGNQGQEPMAMGPQSQSQSNIMDQSHMEDIKSGKINPSTGHYTTSAMERHYNITRNFRDLTDGHFDSAASNHT